MFTACFSFPFSFPSWFPFGVGLSALPPVLFKRSMPMGSRLLAAQTRHCVVWMSAQGFVVLWGLGLPFGSGSGSGSGSISTAFVLVDLALLLLLLLLLLLGFSMYVFAVPIEGFFFVFSTLVFGLLLFVSSFSAYSSIAATAVAAAAASASASASLTSSPAHRLHTFRFISRGSRVCVLRDSVVICVDRWRERPKVKVSFDLRFLGVELESESESELELELDSLREWLLST